MRWSLLYLCLLWLTISGCGAALRTDRTVYKPGDNVEVQLESCTFLTTKYNLCVIEIQKKIGNSWKYKEDVVARASTRNPLANMCTLALHPLYPFSSVSTIKKLSKSAPSGVYRWALEIRVGNEEQTVVTKPIQIVQNH